MLQIFRRFGFDASAIADLSDLIHSGGILSALGAGEHLLHILREMYTRSWFVTRFCTGGKICMTLLGSRPGRSFADLVFAFVYYRILDSIRQAAEQERIYVLVMRNGACCPWSGGPGPAAECAKVLDTTWADDTDAVVTAPEPRMLVHRAQRLTAVIVSTCRAHGLRPNLKRGKSALMTSLRGNGCRAVAAEFFAGGSACASCALVGRLHSGSACGRSVHPSGHGARMGKQRDALLSRPVPSTRCAPWCYRTRAFRLLPEPRCFAVQLGPCSSTLSCGRLLMCPGAVFRAVSGSYRDDYWRSSSRTSTTSILRSMRLSILQAYGRCRCKPDESALALLPALCDQAARPYGL